MSSIPQSLAGALKRVYTGLVAQATAGQPLAPEAVWLVDNYAFVQTQIREVAEGLPQSYWRRLPHDGNLPRVYGIAREIAQGSARDGEGRRRRDIIRQCRCIQSSPPQKRCHAPALRCRFHPKS